ncbi:MAG TPA: hypothetical protein VM689_15465 [Aliidongia sp.]|nr:hypothetical protein [Aliidongia sp.]
MDWQIRYQVDGRTAMRLVQGLDAAILEASRLLADGREVRRIEAPSAGCAISADTVRQLCRRYGAAAANAADRSVPESLSGFAAIGFDGRPSHAEVA